MSAKLATACFRELLRDVNERKKTELALLDLVRKAGHEREELLVHLVRAQETERLRIASDIHDDSIQAMAAAGLRLQQLRKRLRTEAEVEALDRLEDAFQGAISRLRHLMFNLRPVALDRSGLAAALQVHLDQLQSSGSVVVEMENHLTGEPPPETRVMLYRIAIEALANVQKHAGALSGAGAPGERRQGVAGVQIDDDGSGFTPNRNGSPPGHLGLTDMRERAEMAGGWWKLESHPGAGTSVAFWLPAVPEVTLPSPQALPAPT